MSQTPGATSSHAGVGRLGHQRRRASRPARRSSARRRGTSRARARCPCVPSVTMNGTTRSRVIEAPLMSADQRARAHARDAAATTARTRRRCSSERGHDRRERDHRADREVDAAADDDERHADRAEPDDDRLRRDRLEVVDGEERLGLERREERRRPATSPSERPASELISRRAERRRQAIVSPAGAPPRAATSRSTPRPGAPRPSRPRLITAMRSQTPSSSGR